MHLRELYPLEIFEILQSSDPVKILNSWKLKSKTIAKRALKIGLQDLISQIKAFPQELRSTIDKDLAANKLPSLNELQSTIVKIVARVLKRQQMKTLEEFYIVKEEVIDLSSNLTDTNRKLPDKILTEFKLSKVNN